MRRTGGGRSSDHRFFPKHDTGHREPRCQKRLNWMGSADGWTGSPAGQPPRARAQPPSPGKAFRIASTKWSRSPTVLLLAFITNNAVAVLVFPIAASAAMDLGLDVRAFAIAVAVTTSASFLTPIAYQTHLMVYGPGGYRFGDYARLGWPLTLVVLAIVLLLTPTMWG